MDSLVTTAQLAARLDVSEAALPGNALEVLKGLSAKVRTVTGQTISQVAVDEAVLRGSGSYDLRLPQRPVGSVASVADGDGNPVTGTTLRGGVLRWTSRWVDGEWYTVTYSHGYAATPDDLVEVICSRYKRMADNPENIAQETLGSWSYSFSQQAPAVAWTDEEWLVLRKYGAVKRRVSTPVMESA